MYLLIDTLSLSSHIILWDDSRKIIDQVSWKGVYQEFEMTAQSIDNMLSRQNLLYSDISGIFVFHGPGGFTGTRITCLVANTLLFTHQIPLAAINYFDVLTLEGCEIPFAIEVNRRELLIRDEKNDRIITKKEIEKRIYHWIGSEVDFEEKNAKIYTSRDYWKILEKLNTSTLFPRRIQALYAKDPNITPK